MRRMFLLTGAIALVGGLLATTATPSGAAITCTKTWDSGSGLWNDPDIADHLEDQWAPAGVPSHTDTVCLPDGAYTVTMVVGADVEDLRIGEDTTEAQPTLEVTGDEAGDNLSLRAFGTTGVENYGTLRLGHATLSTTTYFQLTPGVFHNFGTIDLMQGGGGQRGLDGNPGGTYDNEGTLQVSSANATWGCTTFGSSGEIGVEEGASLDWGNCGQVHLDLTGGTVTNDGTLVAPSSLDVGGDTVIAGSNPITATTGGLNFSGSPSGRILAWNSSVGSDIPADIEIIVDHPEPMFGGFLGATTSIINYGTVTLTSEEGFGNANLSFPLSTFTNEGTIRMEPGGGGFRGIDGNPHGTLVNHGTLQSSGNGSWGCALIESDGVIDVDAGARLEWGNCGQVHVNLTGGTVTNDGLLVAPSSLDVGGDTVIGGTNPIRVSSGSVGFTGSPSGTIQAWASSITGTIPSDITLVIDNPSADAGGTVNASGAVTNEGTIILRSDGNSGSAELGLSGQTLTNTGTIRLEPGPGGTGPRRVAGGTLVNQGLLEVATSEGFTGCQTTTNKDGGQILVAPGAQFLTNCGGHALTIEGGQVDTMGVLQANVTLTGGELSGSGTVLGPVTNTSGLVTPGASPGILTIDGSYTQGAGGVLGIDYSGPAAGTGHDRLAVTGAASLDGTVRVDVSAIPSPASQFLTASSVTGTFDVAQVPAPWVTYAPTAASLLAVPTFVDVPLTHQFFLDIEWAAAEGAVSGFPDGTFRPTGTATRQAVAAMFYRLAGSPDGLDPMCSTAPFPDVPTNHVFCGEIAWANEAGLVTGFNDGTFRPANVVSRQSIVAILYRVAGSPEGDEPTCAAAAFSDVPASHVFCGEIAWAVANDVAGGFPDGTFRPGATLTRQVIAAFLHRASTAGVLP